MGVLDNIVRKIIFSGPETISSDWTSPSISIDGIEDGFSIETKYDGGSSVDMKVYLQFSNDNVNFATDIDSEIIIVDNDGVCLVDILDSALLFCRVYIQVTAGNIDVEKIELSGKRRH